MADFREAALNTFTDNPFDLIGKQWMLITAGDETRCNTMTASWGGLGVLWSKPAAFVFIRPQRFTKTFVDTHDTLSLTFFDESFREQLNYLGAVSGRSEDKIAHAGLTTVFDGETPYFKEARMALICRKLYAQQLDPKCFIDPDPDRRCYPEHDYHTMYVCEIQKALICA
ncbi:MAG: flavin reductase [Eubacteriales bacterium]|jgi:flavin reductase (DIM6/NTAB) family NADH-FMN oxidoreductase RutF